MTETRTLIIPMKKSLLQQYSGTMPRVCDAEPTVIRNQLYMSRFALGMEVARIYDSLKVEDYNLDARGWDMARPLIAVAKIFAPKVVDTIVTYVNEQVTERAEDSQERDEIKVLLAVAGNREAQTRRRKRRQEDHTQFEGDKRRDHDSVSRRKPRLVEGT